MGLNKSWLFIYHYPKEEKWSLPKGFSNSLSSKGLNIIDLPFKNEADILIPNKKFIKKNNVEVLLIFYAGYSSKLNSEIIKFKKSCPEVIIINELGDEPQTKCLNYVRASLSDISLTPDLDCQIYWQKRGFNCKWFTHWADTKIFFKKNYGKRSVFLSSTVGRRKYTIFLRLILGSLFKNKYVQDFDNTDFFNASQNVFQYARWDEITRRIFEASACGCCVITNKISSSKNLESIFTHNESIIFYKNRISLIIEIIKLLKNPKKSRRIGSTAAFIVENYHTDKVRADQLIEYVKEYKINRKDYLVN